MGWTLSQIWLSTWYNRAQKLGLTNLYSIQGTADSPQLPKKVDLVLFVDVFHHIADRVK